MNRRRSSVEVPIKKILQPGVAREASVGVTRLDCAPNNLGTQDRKAVEALVGGVRSTSSPVRAMRVTHCIGPHAIATDKNLRGVG